MNPRSLAALPPEAKRLLAHVAEHRDKLPALARVRRWQVEPIGESSHVVYPKSLAIPRLLERFKAACGEDTGIWYMTVRRATSTAVLGVKAPIHGEWSTPAWQAAGGTRILAAADLELQGLVVLAIIDRALPRSVWPADRAWLEKAARKVKLLPVP